jgi:hypothetical protein
MSIHVELRMVLKSARCTVDMLSQILNYKTEDVGKASLLLIKDNI